MKENNNVNLEGVVIECALDVLPSKNLQYANMIVSTSSKRVDGTIENAYHRVRFPVSPDMAESIARIGNTCKVNLAQLSGNEIIGVEPNLISVSGELRLDKYKQPFILADEKDINFPDRISSNNNRISLEGTVHSILHSSSVAATLMVNVKNGEKGFVQIPVIIDSRKNPVEWASIASGKTESGDNIKVEGRLDGKLYGHGPNKDVLLRTAVLTQNIALKNNLKNKEKQGKSSQQKI